MDVQVTEPKENVLNRGAVRVSRVRRGLTAKLRIAVDRAHVGGFDDDGVEGPGVRGGVRVGTAGDGEAAAADVTCTKARRAAERELRYRRSVAVGCCLAAS